MKGCGGGVVMIVDKDVRVAVGWRQGVVVDGDDC